MSQQPNHYYPGGLALGMNYGADKVTYPFLNYPTKDATTKIYEVSRWQLAANYTPQTALATYAGNPNAYLVDESDVTIDDKAQAKYRLKFAMIPTNQVQTISRSITRPAVRNTYVTTVGATASPVTVVLYNGGAQLDIADDGSYIGNCLASGIYKQVYGPTSPTSFDGTYIIVADTSGFNTSNAFSAYDASQSKMLIYARGEWGVVNSTAINVSGGITSGVKYCAPYLRTYNPGTVVLQLRQTESFYLPNVSPGITTPTDIPVPTPVINDIDYFSRISGNAGSSYVTYDYDGPVQWMGPMYRLTQWEMQVKDM